jgi:hypothetical protein
MLAISLIAANWVITFAAGTIFMGDALTPLSTPSPFFVYPFFGDGSALCATSPAGFQHQMPKY